ncbi:RluA family pseudouridine synthase [Ideonella livida]|uniref:Pseudouridine synthase n=1 Tax=Ideonella livida TaxID=2707176 RepID=A0A7C9PFM6_9BURK|nr:RluA family pseudouridine synthase [Ideonella livida]
MTDDCSRPLSGGQEPEAAEAGEGEEALLEFDARVPAADHGERLDRYLAAQISSYSRSHLQGLIEAGHVLLDGLPVLQSSRKLKSGQRLQARVVAPEAQRAFQAEDLPLDIVFEDEHLLVVNKPAGLVVHPAAGHWQGTLLNGLLGHHASAAQLPRAGIVHRLDKDTSGLMVVGKTLAAVTSLVRDLAARQVSRHYLALAWGAAQAGEQRRFDGPIGRDPASRIRMAVVAAGKPAMTDALCLGGGQGMAAWVCKLHSGRTHQIRVHLSQAGHPLVADTVYGGRPALGLGRQALHARRLGFCHPATGAPLSFEAPLPADMAQAWALLAVKPWQGELPNLSPP